MAHSLSSVGRDLIYKLLKSEDIMKSAIVTLSLLFVFSISITGQDKTDETRVTVNKTTGDTTFTESVTVSLTQDITPRNSLIVINPLKFLLFYNISYFHKISDQAVVGGGFQIPTLSGLDGFGMNAEVRFYPSGNNLRGFYVAPNFSFNRLTSDDGSTSPASLGLLVGWQWFPGEQFAMGLGIGVDYYFGSVKDANENLESYNGSAPALRFDIGYAW
jgi:hypothetical protein